MHGKGVSHGDISSGNIMVEEMSRGIRLHLVDFDSFYAPEICDLATISPGHPDWQHPGYIGGKLNLFGLQADYCPFLLMAMTLESLSLDLNLYDRYASKATDGSGILIRKNDLNDHLSSAVLNEMRMIADEDLAMHIYDLDKMLEADSANEVEFPTSLKDQYEAPPDIVTRVNRVSIGGEFQVIKRRRRLREVFHKPADVENFLNEHQPTVREVQKNLHFNRKNRANLERIEGGLTESYRLCIEHFGGIEKADPTIVVPYAWGLFNSGNTAESKRIAEHVYSVSPSNANNAHLLCSKIYGDTYRGERNWSRIIEIAKDVLDKSPSAVLISCAKAKAEKKLGLYESYADAYEETLIRTQRDWKTLNSMVYDANKDNEFDTAVEAFFEILTMDTDLITKLSPKMILNLLSPGLYSLRRCGLSGYDTADLLSTINPEILMLERKYPNTSQINKLSHAINNISDRKFNPQTMWIALGMKVQNDLVSVLSALATLGIGEPINGLDSAVQHMLSRAGARTPEGRSLHLSFRVDDPLCFERDGKWITYLERTQLRGPPPGLE
jgi:tetratricopeptide (TPR) repeat protein